MSRGNLRNQHTDLGSSDLGSLQAVEKLTVSKKLIRVFSLYGNMPLN